MNKIVWILFFVLINSIWLIAQNTDDFGWKVFSGNQDEFTVNAPAGFELVDYNKNVEDSMKGYRVKANGLTFAVWTAKDKQSSHFSIISSFIQNNKAEGIDTLIDSYKGKVFNFTDSDGSLHQIAFVETDSRFFIFHTFGFAANNEKFAQFFDTIKINKAFTQFKKATMSFPPINKPENKTPPVKNTSTGGGQGVGQGGGNVGVKPIENKPTDAEAIKAAPVVEPLQITSKPRASYTDMARIYWIQGTISLRVTFLANGTIGSVSPISGLPLGLNQTSIQAAKNLAFKPALKNGIPQTVTKTVQYSFTLY